MVAYGLIVGTVMIGGGEVTSGAIGDVFDLFESFRW